MSYVTHAFSLKFCHWDCHTLESKSQGDEKKPACPKPWSRRDIGALLALIRKVRWGVLQWVALIMLAFCWFIICLFLLFPGEMEGYRDMEEIDVFHAF